MDENGTLGDQCEPTAMFAQQAFIRQYSQNNNAISDSTGLKNADTFKQLKGADVDKFSINETHADKINAKNNKVLK